MKKIDKSVIKHHAKKLLILTVLSGVYSVIANALPNDEQSFQVVIDKSRFIQLKQNVNQITLGNADIADIQVLDEHNLYIVGRKLGSTNITFSDKKGNSSNINIEVTHDIDGLKTKLHELVPSENPGVYSSQNSIVLNGQISSAEKMDSILAIANTFLHSESSSKTEQPAQGMSVTVNPAAGGDSKSGKESKSSVINMMQIGGPQQVMLEVKVAEVDRSLAKNLKVNFDVMKTGGSWQTGAVGASASPIADLGAIVTRSISPFGLFARFLGHNTTENAVINASRTNGLIKILAEPTLTTVSGQSADFLSGGEFPIPVQKSSGSGAGIVTVDYKEYGVATKFLPVVLDSGNISLKLSIDVSELNDMTNDVISTGASSNGTPTTLTIKGLTKRRANSTVELADGQTIGIAGLISENVNETINKFPGLAELPIIGQLFTSQSFLKNQTELVIFVTPRLVKPMPNSKPKLPTDNFVEPSDSEFYLLGRTEALDSKVTENIDDNGGGLEGRFGQTVY